MHALPSNPAADDRLLARFVAALSAIGDLLVWNEAVDVPAELDAGRDDLPSGQRKWRPALIETPRSDLDPLYEAIHAEFPSLYERLVLSYRWLEVEIEGVARLFANPPGPLSAGLSAEILSDQHHTVLLPAGLIPFGRVAGDNFDPICFDIGNHRQGDYPIVQIDHEEMICGGTVHQRRELWPTFRSFVEAVLAAADDAAER